MVHLAMADAERISNSKLIVQDNNCSKKRNKNFLELFQFFPYFYNENAKLEFVK